MNEELNMLHIGDVNAKIRAYENINVNFVHAEIPNKCTYEYPLDVMRFNLTTDAAISVQYDAYVGMIKIRYLTSDGKTVDREMVPDEFVNMLFGDVPYKYKHFADEYVTIDNQPIKIVS